MASGDTKHPDQAGRREPPGGGPGAEAAQARDPARAARARRRADLARRGARARRSTKDPAGDARIDVSVARLALQRAGRRGPPEALGRRLRHRPRARERRPRGHEADRQRDPAPAGACKRARADRGGVRRTRRGRRTRTCCTSVHGRQRPSSTSTASSTGATCRTTCRRERVRRAGVPEPRRLPPLHPRLHELHPAPAGQRRRRGRLDDLEPRARLLRGRPAQGLRGLEVFDAHRRPARRRDRLPEAVGDSTNTWPAAQARRSPGGAVPSRLLVDRGRSGAPPRGRLAPHVALEQRDHRSGVRATTDARPTRAPPPRRASRRARARERAWRWRPPRCRPR